MEERAACALLKARFEAAGYAIEENVTFAEATVEFEIDGYDATRRVGYEYVTDEAGDGWDVDAAVVEKLNAARQGGDVFILVVDEKEAPDAATLGARADAFLAELTDLVTPKKPNKAAARTAAKSAANKPAAKPTAKKPDAKPAAKKPVAKPAAKKPGAMKPAAKKPAAKKPAAKKK